MHASEHCPTHNERLRLEASLATPRGRFQVFMCPKCKAAMTPDEQREFVHHLLADTKCNFIVR